MATIRESNLPNLVFRGKVRDTHNIDDNLFLMIATDRISAFDVVLPTSIPDKGAVLSQMSAFWFSQTDHIVGNHMVAMATDSPGIDVPTELARRGMVVRKAERIDVECVVRGYITGSAWSEYKKTKTVSGLDMPAGLVEGDKFPEPLFTPTTKAEVGHDENMSFAQVVDMVGANTAGQLRDTSKAIYMFAHDLANEKGILIADTKMEFGFIDGNLTLIDELLTPDSSRFWDLSGYAPGKSQPNFDKQFVRDWLDSQGWNHEPPAPNLPQDVVDKTQQRYFEAHLLLTGEAVA